MRVLIADKLPDTFRTLLQEAQAEVVVDASLKGDALSAALAEHDIEEPSRADLDLGDGLRPQDAL